MDTEQQSCDATNSCSWLTLLLALRHSHTDSRAFVDILASELRRLFVAPRDLEDLVGAIRGAAALYLGERTNRISGPVCSFCAKGRNEVRTLMVSANAAICDECGISTLKTICQQPGQRLLRFAYSVFE